MKPYKSFIIILFFYIALISSCTESPTFIQEEESVELIPKDYNSKTKSFENNEVSPYSCLISTLANKEQEHNYLNEAFWVRLPASFAKESEKETIVEVFVYGDKSAGSKAKSYGNYDKVVRVAQCRIPDSDKVRKELEKEFIKFGKNSWLDEEERANQKEQGSSDGDTVDDWEWVCVKYFITIVCDSNSCTVTDIRCISWELEFNDDTSSGGGGFPSEDPGDCDPLGIEPCYEDGGGSSPAPNDEDPCEVPNPPVWCSCNDTNDPILDNIGIKEEFFNLWQDSNGDAADPLNRVEQGMWITKDPITGEYGTSKFDIGFSNFDQCGFDYGSFVGPANTIGWAHTQPFDIGEVMYSCYDMSKALIDMLIQAGATTYIYNGVPSVEDLNFLQVVEAQTGLNLKSYLIDKNGITEFDENSSVTEIGNAPRHSRNCY